MKISVITPVLNGEKYIRRTIESVLSQTGSFEIEYIIKDGGSTDKTLSIVREYVDRCILIVDRDASLTQAIQQGFSQATGDVLCWINADDYYESGAFQRVVDAFNAYPDCQWCYGLCRIVDAQNKVIRKWITWYKNFLGWYYSYHILLCENYINQPAVFWRHNLWKSVKGMQSAYKLAFDYELWLKMGQLSKAIPIHAYLAHFRRDHYSLSDRYFQQQFKEEITIASFYGNKIHRFIHAVLIKMRTKMYEMFYS